MFVRGGRKCPKVKPDPMKSLLAVFAKNERANLTKAEVNLLGNAAKMLARKYGE